MRSDLVWLTRDELKAHCAKVQAVADECDEGEPREAGFKGRLADALLELGHSG